MPPPASENRNGSGPRYAPDDPMLPKPWKCLVDGTTGHLYYWNPETSVTQYEKPVKEKLPGPPPLPPPPSGKPASVSSSVHRGEPPHGEDRRGRSHHQTPRNLMEVEETSPVKKSKTGPRWLRAEEKLLINAWLNIERDVIPDIEDKPTSFWGRIEAYYHEYCDELKVPRRPQKQLKDHFSKMSNAVNKFQEAYFSAKSVCGSGQSDHDIMLRAHEIYKRVSGKPFSFEYAWGFLKDEQKWKTHIREMEKMKSAKKRTKNNEAGQYTEFAADLQAVEEEEKKEEEEEEGDADMKELDEQPIDIKAATTEMGKDEQPASTISGKWQDVGEQKFTLERKVVALETIAKAKSDKVKAMNDANEMKEYEIYMMDTSNLSEKQLRIHQKMCRRLEKKWTWDVNQ